VNGSAAARLASNACCSSPRWVMTIFQSTGMLIGWGSSPAIGGRSRNVSRQGKDSSGTAGTAKVES